MSPESANGAPRPFHVLALSGGGFRGLYTATVLRYLEEKFKVPVAHKFDLICGTSIGGLLALGLAAEIPATDLQGLFLENGRRIFGSPSRAGRILRALRSPFVSRHQAHGLKRVLEETFEARTIGDLRHRVLVPAVNYSTGRGQFFKTPHAEAFYRDHVLRLVDVGLATTAAPTYFPVHEIPNLGPFVDGGLVANSPGLLGVHEAEQFLGVSGPHTVRVLAVGTMSLGASIGGSATRNRGLFHWGTKIFDLVISAQEYAGEAMLRHKLGNRYYSIDDPATPDQSRDISNLDLASQAATRVLISRGSHAAQRTIGDSAFAPFLNHAAAKAQFFHGPNKNT